MMIADCLPGKHKFPTTASHSFFSAYLFHLVIFPCSVRCVHAMEIPICTSLLFFFTFITTGKILVFVHILTQHVSGFQTFILKPVYHRIISVLTECHDWVFGNPIPYSGVHRIKSRPLGARTLYSEWHLFCSFPQSLEANAGIVP